MRNTDAALSIGISLLIVGAVLLSVIGYFVFISVTHVISGPSSSAMMNTTMNTGSNVFNVVGIILPIALAIGIIGLLFHTVSTQRRYEQLGKALKFLVSSCYYFGFGLLAIIIVAIPGYFLWFLWNYTVVDGNAGAFIEVAKWIGIFIVAFFAISGLGYIFKKKFVDKFILRRQEQTYKENLKELPGNSL